MTGKQTHRVVFTATVLIVMFTGGLSLFAAGGQEASESADSESETVTLEYWHWSPDQNDVVSGIIADFEEAHPNIRVEQTSMVPSDYWTRMRLNANQNNLPDVLEMSSGFLESWANDGFLYDITPFVNDAPEIENFYENLVESGRTIPGTQEYYALPYAFVMPVLYFNKDMFDEAGLSYPDESWDWDEFRNAAEELTVDEDGDGEPEQWGFHAYGRYAQIEPWVYANNGRLIDREAMRFDPDERGLEALSFVTSLITEHGVAPEPSTVSEIDTEEVFAQQIAGMWVDGSWNIGYMRDNIGDEFEYGIAPVPAGPQGDRSLVYGWADFAAIGRDTEHPEAAWQFLTFLAGEGRSLDNIAVGKLPAYRELAEDPSFIEPDRQPAEKSILIDLADREPVTSFTKSWSEWRGYGPAEELGLNGILDNIMNGRTSFSAGMDLAEENINDILEREY